MLKVLQYTFHFTLLFTQLRANFSLSRINDASETSVFHILVDLIKVRQTSTEQALLDNLLHGHTRLKVIFNMSNLALRNIKHYNRCNHFAYVNPKSTPHFQQESTFIIMPAIPNWLLEPGQLYGIQSNLASCAEYPSFLFLVDTGVTAQSMILAQSNQSYPIKLPTKLFVLNPKESDIHVFCYPCGDFPLRRITNNPPNLIQQWKLYNHDFNKKTIVRAMGSNKFSRKLNTCFSLRYSGRRFPWYVTCVQLALGKLYNFTDVEIDNEKIPAFPPANQVIYYNGMMTMSDLDALVLDDSSERWSLLIYNMKIVPTIITVISLKSRTTVDSLGTFLTPFDSPTWIGIIISVLAISFVIAFPKLEESLSRAATSFGKVLFWTYACLSGQYGGTNEILRILPSPKPFIVIAICSFFMIGSEFYQGSLFSSLIATIPPQLPQSNQEALDSNLEIITIGSTFGSPNVHGKYEYSVVVDLMIPALLEKTSENSRLHQMLIKLKNKAIYVSTLYTGEFWAGWKISDSLEFDFNHHKKQLKETFAIVGQVVHVSNFVEGLRTKRVLWSKTFEGFGLFHILPVV